MYDVAHPLENVSISFESMAQYMGTHICVYRKKKSFNLLEYHENIYFTLGTYSYKRLPTSGGDVLARLGSQTLKNFAKSCVHNTTVHLDGEALDNEAR